MTLELYLLFVQYYAWSTETMPINIYIRYLNIIHTPNSFDQEDLQPTDLLLKNLIYSYQECTQDLVFNVG
jgi:hypothetical protein